MKKLLLILTICTLSGCGLFRKKTKVSNSSEQIVKSEISTEVKEQVKSEIKGANTVRSAEQKQVQKDIDEHTTLTADEIEVKPDGSIKAKGSAKLDRNKKDKGSSNTTKEVEQNNMYVGHINALSENKGAQKQETKVKVKETHSQTEPKGSIWIWAAVGFLLLIGGLLFLRRKGVI